MEMPTRLGDEEDWKFNPGIGICKHANKPILVKVEEQNI